MYLFKFSVLCLGDTYPGVELLGPGYQVPSGVPWYLGSPGGASSTELACQCQRHKRHEFDLWVGKIPGGGNGNPFQYPCLENPMPEEPARLGATESELLKQLGTAMVLLFLVF